MTHPTDDQTQQSRTSAHETEPQAPGPDDLETAKQFRDHFGGRSRQWEHRLAKSDPDYPKVVYVGPRRFYRPVDRIKYVRKLEERSAKKAADKAAKAAEKARQRELTHEADTDND